MRHFLHTLVAWAMAEPGHLRLRDVLAWHLTTRVPLVARLRGWWADREERRRTTPGFRAWDR